MNTTTGPGSLQHQRGVALATVLILLLVMTLLALASLRGTLLESRMSASQLDRGYAFQAAEAALREAEARAAASDTSDFPAAGCLDGLCAPPVATAADRWNVASTWAGGESRVATAPISQLASAPRYIIEWMKNPDTVTFPTGGWPDSTGECTTSGDVSPDAQCTDVTFRYRITVRTQAPGRAAVILQSNYVAP